IACWTSCALTWRSRSSTRKRLPPARPRLRETAVVWSESFPPLPSSTGSSIARRGHVRQILAEAQRLQALDGRYAPFVAEVRALTEQFQVKKLCQLLEQARSKV